MRYSSENRKNRKSSDSDPPKGLRVLKSTARTANPSRVYNPYRKQEPKKTLPETVAEKRR
jgi:hypothetical protein